MSSSILKSNFAVLNPLASCDGIIEKALIRKWNINGVVCRQSGGANEELWHQVCSSMGIDLWLLERPNRLELIESVANYDELRNRLKYISMSWKLLKNHGF